MEYKIFEKDLNEELKNSYLLYSLSVIVSRAIPDVRDGLKPVHRRILYSMSELSLRHNSSFKNVLVLLEKLWVNIIHMEMRQYMMPCKNGSTIFYEVSSS